MEEAKDGTPLPLSKGVTGGGKGRGFLHHMAWQFQQRQEIFDLFWTENLVLARAGFVLFIYCTTSFVSRRRIYRLHSQYEHVERDSKWKILIRST